MNQLSDEDKIDRSNFIINNLTIKATQEQVEKINIEIRKTIK
jgi:hypothetical protein